MCLRNEEEGEGVRGRGPIIHHNRRRERGGEERSRNGLWREMPQTDMKRGERGGD